jgi:hypothetical protein
MALYMYWLDLALDDREIVVRFSARATDFSLLQNAQAGSGTTHPASYSTVTGGKTWRWPPTCIQCGYQRVQKPSYLCSTRCDVTHASHTQSHCNAAKTCLFLFLCLFLHTATRRRCLTSFSGDCKYSEDARHKTCPQESVMELLDWEKERKRIRRPARVRTKGIVDQTAESICESSFSFSEERKHDSETQDTKQKRSHH